MESDPGGDSFALLSYQTAAVEWLSTRKRGLVQSPAGSGKTIIAAAALDRVLRRKPRAQKVRVGWVANTLEQLEQARAAIARFPVLSESIDLALFCPAGVPENLVVDVLVVDEAHHAPALTWRAIIEAHRGALWLFSATPFGDDEERNVLVRSLVDGEIFVVSREEVASRVLPAHVFMLRDTDQNLRDAIDAEIAETIRRRQQFGKRLSYEDLYRQTSAHVALALGVIPNAARNAAIVARATAHAEESTLILVPTIDHGEALAERLPGSILAYSRMGAKKRREAVAAFRAGNLRCLLATSLADEGLDVPCASVLIMAGAGRSAARVEQRTGRVLRAHGDKTHGTIYDFEDPQHPLLARQSLARQKVYRKLGYLLHRNHQTDQL